jgi:hypothetical protein
MIATVFIALGLGAWRSTPSSAQSLPNPGGGVPPPPTQAQLAQLIPLAWSMVGQLASVALSIPPPAVPSPSGPATPSGGGCGSIHIGGAEIPLDCHFSGYGFVSNASEVVGAPSPGAGEEVRGLPSHVDHRADGTEGDVRWQGRVGTCTAFSLASAIDHALLSLGKEAVQTPAGDKPRVSALHAWAHYHAAYMDKAATGVLGRPLTAEASWPFPKSFTPVPSTAEKEACSWDVCMDAAGFRGCEKLGVHCGTPVNGAEWAVAEAKPFATVTHITPVFPHRNPGLATNGDIESLAPVLAKGEDIWFSMKIPSDNTLSPDNLLRGHDGLSFVVPDSHAASSPSGHAILLSGYTSRPSGLYFLIHNSWGEDWGERGYAWISAATLRANIEAAYIVTAQYWTARPNAGPLRQCPINQAFDTAGTGLCLPLCSDGSPTFNGACPVSCLLGQTNGYPVYGRLLGGRCVFAAPTGSGVSPVSKVSHRCGPGGCSYTIPNGAYGCAHEWCSVSCAAPRSRLVNGSIGFTCLP